VSTCVLPRGVDSIIPPELSVIVLLLPFSLLLLHIRFLRLRHDNLDTSCDVKIQVFTALNIVGQICTGFTADPDPGQTLPSLTVEFLHDKYSLCKQ
jgi:hypothetical protein